MDRQSAESELNNMGYKHPETNNTTESVYKKYVSGKKNPYTSCSKNEDYKTNLIAYEHDGNVTNLNTTKIRKIEKCPVCFEIAESSDLEIFFRKYCETKNHITSNKTLK